MAYDYSAQNSITIKRLRANDSLTLSFDNNGIPLFQGVDSESGVVSPDWTKAANQPIRTPKVISSHGLAVALSNHTWTYNGVALKFSGAESSGWKADSTGKFQMNTTTGAIKIIANLASKTNIAGDTLIYSCVATVAGVEYNLTKDLPIVIQNIGASSYYLAILATTEQLTSKVTSTSLQTKLYLGANEASDYYVKWYKDTAAWADKNGQKLLLSEEVMLMVLNCSLLKCTSLPVTHSLWHVRVSVLLILRMNFRLCATFLQPIKRWIQVAR